MIFEFKLPDIGEGIAEGEIIKWFVTEGDKVEEDQPIVEVMTDKVNVELPSPVKGKVLHILTKEGDVVPVGDIIIILDAEAGAQTPRIPEKKQELHLNPTKAVEQTTTSSADRVLAAPATRRLARELEVELSQIQGTGPEGRVMDNDVKRFAESDARKNGVVSLAKEQKIPLRGIRRTIADRMIKSKRTAPHATHMDEVDLTELVLLREKMKKDFEGKGARLTYLTFVTRAVVNSLMEHPYLNASLNDEKGEIVLKMYYNIGVASATDDGLVVPVVKGADTLTLLELTKKIGILSRKARLAQLGLDDVQEGTFTITNIGSIGGLASIPIINHPEVAILGVHKIVKKPVYRDGAIQPRDMMFLTLSFDHRVLDGAEAAKFINKVIKYLEKPVDLLDRK